MKCKIAVMTHNAMSTLRVDLLERTLESMALAFPKADARWLLDNGSSDGTFEMLHSGQMASTHGWKVRQRLGENTTPGAGRNALLALLLGGWPPPLEPEIIVLSDDDMLWKVGSQNTLSRLWGHPRCPDDLAIVSGLLEPEYPWNAVREAIQIGDDRDGVRVLVRASAPGAAWTFRYGGSRAHGIGPLYHACNSLADGDMVNGRRTVFVEDFGYDSLFCKELATVGLRVAELDLADHIGWGCSTHGNDAVNDVRTKPLDRKKWGM